jgi:hypothetical protein
MHLRGNLQVKEPLCQITVIISIMKKTTNIIKKTTNINVIIVIVIIVWHRFLLHVNLYCKVQPMKQLAMHRDFAPPLATPLNPCLENLADSHYEAVNEARSITMTITMTNITNKFINNIITCTTMPIIIITTVTTITQAPWLSNLLLSRKSTRLSRTPVTSSW